MTPIRSIKIRYFAILRDQRGLGEEVVETAAETPAALYEELAQSSGLRFARKNLRVAVNGDFSNWDRTLRSGDEVVFIPPVAGG